MLAAPVRAGNGLPEAVLKARILVGLLPYVQWPDPGGSGSRPFVIGLLGQSPFGTALDDCARASTVHHRPIVIRQSDRLDALEGCEALYICPSALDRLDAAVAWAQGRRVLTVSDAARGVGHGVMVVLHREGAYVRLIVDPSAAAAQGLTFGSLLLRNARIVGPMPRGPSALVR